MTLRGGCAGTGKFLTDCILNQTVWLLHHAENCKSVLAGGQQWVYMETKANRRETGC